MSDRLKRIVVTLPYTLPVFVASFAAVAVGFLVVDFFVTVYVWITGLVIAFLASFFTYKYTTQHVEASRKSVLGALLVLGACGLWFVGNAHFTSQHFFVDRDPGIYVNTAAWLVNHDNLQIESNESIFNHERVTDNGSGFGKTDDNTVTVQGAHAFPALLGLAGRIVGVQDMLHIVPIFGAMAIFVFYGFLRLLVKKQRWAIAGTALLSICLPLIYFSRDAYSEPLALIFVFGSLSLFHLAYKTNAKIMWLMAGVVTGASALTRIDALLSIAGLMVAVFAAVVLADVKKRKSVLAGALIFIVATLLLFALAYYDLSYLAEAYLADHMHLLRRQMVVAGGVLGVGILVSLLSFRKNITEKVIIFYSKHQRKITISAVYVLIAGWLVLLSRPMWYVGQGVVDNIRVREAQSVGGLMVDGWRTYAENSLEWITWYIGFTTLLLAIIGLIVAVVKMLNSKNIIFLALVAVVGGASIIYINIPSISADHIWAARRFLPVVIPGFIALAILTLASIDSMRQKFPQGIRSYMTPMLMGLFGFCFVGTAIATQPFVTTRTYDHQLTQIQEVCEALPPGATLLLRGGYTFVAVQSFRSVCGDVTVGYMRTVDDLPNSTIKKINDSVRRAGSELYIVALGTNEPSLANNSVTVPFNISVSEEYESTLLRRPQTTKPYILDLYIGRVMPNGQVVPFAKDVTYE